MGLSSVRIVSTCLARSAVAPIGEPSGSHTFTKN